MEIYRPSISLFETTMYRISILGTLDKNWSDYCGGMTIEHRKRSEGICNVDPDRSIGRPIRVDWRSQFAA